MALLVALRDGLTIPNKVLKKGDFFDSNLLIGGPLTARQQRAKYGVQHYTTDERYARIEEDEEPENFNEVPGNKVQANVRYVEEQEVTLEDVEETEEEVPVTSAKKKKNKNR